MSMIVELQDVHKKIGAKTIIEHLSCNLEKGKIIGLLGANGSGKTTLLKMLAGLVFPTDGTIKISGQTVGYHSKKHVSYMSDKPFLESWMKVEDAISFYKDFYSDFDHEKINDMLSFMGLDLKEPIKNMSKGMNERLQLSLTLSRNTSLYLLDEPIGGVDPVARDKIFDALLEYYNPNSTLIIVTHLIHDIERLFDEVIILKTGKLVLHENVEMIRQQRNIGIEQLFKEVYLA